MPYLPTAVGSGCGSRPPGHCGWQAMSRPAGMGSGGDFRSPQSARGRACAHVRCQGSSLCSCRCLTSHLCPSVNHGSQSRCLKRSRPRPHWRRRQPHRLGQWRASAQAPRGAHAAASCRGSGKGRISGCAGHGQHKSARVSDTPRTAWATPRSGPPTAETGPTSPQTARSTTTTSNFGSAVNSSIVPVFSTGRLAQGRPGTRTWNNTCAQRQGQSTNKSNVRPPKSPAMCTNATASTRRASHYDPTWTCRRERSSGQGHYPARGPRASARLYIKNIR